MEKSQSYIVRAIAGYAGGYFLQFAKNLLLTSMQLNVCNIRWFFPLWSTLLQFARNSFINGDTLPG